jgi:hypothetical protein
MYCQRRAPGHALERPPSARFSLGGQPRPHLWDAVMRSLVLPPVQNRPPLPQPEEEHDDGNSSSAVVVKRSKTNSERGRSFRARRKKYEDDLVTIVASLRQEVADLGFLRSVRADKVLHSRNSLNGSLVRLAREYFSLFEFGMSSARAVGQKRPALLTDDSLEAQQKAFLDSAMDPELQFGGASGPAALLDQWKRYTSYHSSISVEVVGVEVSGEEDNPMVTVRSDLHVVFSHATFDNVFPHVADNQELVRKFVGREVVYHGVNRFQFSPQGQILVYDSDVGFVDALVAAGANVSDIALLMQQARIADESRIGVEDECNNQSGNVHEPEQGNQEPREASEDEGYRDGDSVALGGSDAEEASAPGPSRLAIDFLLS